MNIHQVNIILHVIAGTVGLIIGVIAILLRHQPGKHRQFGKVFLYLLTIVVVSGFLGWLFFRSNSFLLMLTILAGYNGFSGYRIIKLRTTRPTWFDIALTFGALTLGVIYVLSLENGGNWSPTVIYSTLGALGLVTVYDILKYFILFQRIKGWWLYEHIYKMVSAFSALLSAFVGTVLPAFKPYSQVGPSVICVWLIVIFIWQEATRRSLSKSASKNQ